MEANIQEDDGLCSLRHTEFRVWWKSPAGDQRLVQSSEKERGKDVPLRIICTAVAAETMRVDEMALRVGIQRKEEGSDD